MPHFLTGKKAICGFLGRSWTTIEKLIIHQSFPAKLIAGRWESDSELITKWRQRQVAKANRVKRAIKPRGNPNFQ